MRLSRKGRGRLSALGASLVATLPGGIITAPAQRPEHQRAALPESTD
jgi:hypothetical protein